MIKEGVFLGKRYEILGRIGSGGMADVYKGKDHKLNRFVAIKVLKSTYRSDETFIKKFLSEAQAAAGLMHPNVVNVYDVGQDRGLYYMVMELVEGITLKDYIQKKGKLSAKETISISIQMVTGIQAAHNCHIIHRDIKPQNIIISKDGKVKVTDFGIARATTSTATQAVTTTVMGSVHYTSPEQARGGIVDEKSDIYSAGITMYEMITGHVPFDGDSTVTVALKHLNEVIKSPAEEVPDIPYSLECIIMKCTQKLPNKRYMSCEELLQDLKHSLVDPDGDFVVLDGVTKRMPAASQDTGRTTVVMSQDELNRMKRRQNYNDDYDDDYEDDYDDDYDDYDDRRRSRYDDDDDYYGYGYDSCYSSGIHHYTFNRNSDTVVSSSNTDNDIYDFTHFDSDYNDTERGLMAVKSGWTISCDGMDYHMDSQEEADNYFIDRKRNVWERTAERVRDEATGEMMDKTLGYTLVGEEGHIYDSNGQEQAWNCSVRVDTTMFED